jgi:hypothetical protein
MNTINQDLSTMSLADLAVMYNELTGKSIKKFDSKAKGIARIQKVLADMKASHDDELDGQDDPAPKAEETSQATTEKTERGPRAGNRTVEVVELLRMQATTVPEMVEFFDTKYKNITGDLYLIRNRGEKYGLAADERLVKESGAYRIIARK